MFRSLRNRMSQTICKVLQVDINKEDGILNIAKFYFGNLPSYSGGYLSIKPDDIFVYFTYNVFALFFYWCSLAQIVYTVFNSSWNVANMIVMMYLFTLLIVSTVVHWVFLSSRSNINEIFTMINAFSEQERRVDQALIDDVERVRSLSVIWWPTLVNLAWVSILSLRPIIDYLTEDGIINIPVPLVYPFDTTTTLGFWMATVIQSITVYFLCVQINIALPVYVFISKRITMEFSILIDHIQNLEQDSLLLLKSIYKDDEADGIDFLKEPHIEEFCTLYNEPKFIYCYDKCFKNIIAHHQNIIKLFDHYQTFGGLPCLVVLTLASITLAISIYCIIADGVSIPLKVSTFLLVIPEATGIWLLCYYGEQISTMGKQVRYELYFSNWVDCTESVKRSLRIMQANTMRTLNMAGSGFNIRSDYDTFLKIVNSAYTFTNLMYASQK